MAPDRFRCLGHVYEVMSEPAEDPSTGRWLSVTKCLVCEDLTQPIEVSTWEPAESAEMVACVQAVEAEIRRLEGVVATLKGERQWRNFA